eukprot:TRINITY_DN5328_c0_g1_i1.p1 TRINITY_DN5328_c0_g1~~TRINITY_DN5328_c0_g1_i1.p1  ORF type:complete len:259 (+),score=63.83 TRINITY_DN5328_c0_g1_i1:51-779(+)
MTTVVTGASRGIGRAVAEHLSGKGHFVVCCARDKEVADEVARGLPGKGVGVRLPELADLTPEDATEFANEVTKMGGGCVRNIVHAAGMSQSKLLLRTSLEEMDTIMRVNTISPMLLTKAFLARSGLLKNASSSVTFIGSVVGSDGNHGQIPYSASKSALTGLSHSLAKEYGVKGLRSNVISPGFINTNMTAAVTPEQKEMLLKQTALGRFGDPFEVAEVVGFAISCSFLTGQVISVDGGLAL